MCVRVKLDTKHTGIFWRITVKGSRGTQFCPVNEKVKKWLSFNAPKAKVIDEWPDAYIEFPNRDQAILFKLSF